MFTILYTETKKTSKKQGVSYSTEYYNGISLRNKKALTKYVKNVIDEVDFLCNIKKETDAIRYFLTPSKKFPRDLSNKNSKQTTKGRFRTPYEALKEFEKYITEDNPTGGVPGQMINRWNRVWKDKLDSRMLTVAEDDTRYMSRKMEPHYDQVNSLFTRENDDEE